MSSGTGAFTDKASGGFLKESFVFTGEGSPMANLMFSARVASLNTHAPSLRNVGGKASPWLSSTARIQGEET
jgi:hypothetical protein